MKNALIFSPSFIGHRQVYVFVLSQVLIKLGYRIYIAGNFSAKLSSTFYFNRLKGNNNIFEIDTTEILGYGLGINIHEFIELQVKYAIDLTIFAEADNHIPLLISQLSVHKRLKGRTIGIFLRPFYVYQKVTAINKLRYFKWLYTEWKTDTRLFHEFLNPQFHLINESLHLDDYFVSKHRHTKWLPDVFQQFADEIVLEEQSEQRHWIDKLDAFKEANKDCIFLLYFGAPQERRGYDFLLKLAVDYKACFVHCGLRNNWTDYEFDINELRGKLESEKKLFETNEYIIDPITIEYFFKAVGHLILPYKNFYGSSGVMLQALVYNIPVLVPDIGVIGYRVKKYGLGYTYNNGSFEKQFLCFLKTPTEMFSKSIEEYMKMQSVQNLNSVLINSINGEAS